MKRKKKQKKNKQNTKTTTNCTYLKLVNYADIVYVYPVNTIVSFCFKLYSFGVHNAIQFNWKWNPSLIF